jgi:anti-sigma factor RsiW
MGGTMAPDCEQTRGHLLDLLYGELPPDGRAAAEAHLAGCQACRAELAALESTRAHARRALDADSPPPRARAAILRAAAAASPRPAPAPAKPSLWARMRQTRWTLPTFATIGAVAVFLLASRIFLEPEKTYQRGLQGLLPDRSAPASAPLSPAAPVATKPAAATTSDLATTPAKAKNTEAQPVAREAKPAAKSFGGHPKGRGRLEAIAPAPSSSEAPAFAPPPPAREADEGAQDRELREEPSGNVMRSMEKKAAAPAPAAPAPPPAAAAPAPARPAAKAEAPAIDSLAAPAAAGGAAERESPAARADRLFAQRRWADAATAYGQLLRDDPRNANAARWRQRLAACKAAMNDQDR